MDQPAHRGSVELAILRVDRRIVPQDVLHHVRVAVERRPMQRHGAVLRQLCHRKSAAEHGRDGRQVVVARGVGDLMQSLFRRVRYELWIGREGCIGAYIVTAPERIKQSIERTRALEQQVEDLGVVTLARNIECRDMEAERPLVDMPAVWGRIDHRKPVLIDPHGNRPWIRVEMAPRQRDIAERCCEEQIGSCALSDEESRNARAIPDEVLRRGRTVIIIWRVNLGAMLEQKSGNLDRAGEMQRALAVAALRMDEGWVAGNQGRELRYHAEIGRRPDIDPGAAGNEGSGLIRVHLLQQAEAALLPAGPDIEVGAVGKQEIEQLQWPDMHAGLLKLNIGSLIIETRSGRDCSNCRT